jgi:SNF2 family DNA or RNA helicase
MYSTKYLTKTEQQWSYSEYVKEKCFENIEKYGLESYAIFKMYNHLQQIVSGIYSDGMDNPRLDLLMDVVRETTGKVIIWCKYQKSIELIEKELIQEYGQDSVVTFYGKTKKRFEVIQQFRKQARFFVATSSVGGHGLTLNEAKTVIFYENTFKYSERIQAEDRCHRIGQTEKVQYIDLYCLESIDERIDDALSAKKNVSDLIKDKLKEIQDMPKEQQKELLKKWIKNI